MGTDWLQGRDSRFSPNPVISAPLDITQNKKIPNSLLLGIIGCRGGIRTSRPLGYEPNELPAAPPCDMFLWYHMSFALSILFSIFIAKNVVISCFVIVRLKNRMKFILSFFYSAYFPLIVPFITLKFTEMALFVLSFICSS